MKRIEFYNSYSDGWLSATCDFDDAGPREDQAAKERIEGLREENPDIEFRLIDC